MLIETDDENLLLLYREGRAECKAYKRLPKGVVEGFVKAVNYMKFAKDINEVMRIGGLNYKRLAEIFVDYGCKIGFNLDGGGSTVIYFKNDSLGNPQRYGPYDGRMLTDMMYFIEK